MTYMYARIGLRLYVCLPEHTILSEKSIWIPEYAHFLGYFFTVVLIKNKEESDFHLFNSTIAADPK